MKFTTVGKVIGGYRYIHRDYVLMSLVEAQDILYLMHKVTGNFPTILKVNDKTNKVESLIWSPDFDSANEPIVGASMSVKTGKVAKYKPPFWIYHHKWKMVGRDYKGFDVEASMARSWHWINECKDHSRIGRQDVWLKLLKKWKMTP